MNPNQKIELVKGGRKVDGQFQPLADSSLQRIANRDPERAHAIMDDLGYTYSPTPSFSVNIPQAVPSTTLKTPTTFNDVLSRRNQAEQDQLFSQQLGSQYDQLLTRAQSPVAATPFQNPEAFLNQLLLNRPTETQEQLDATRAGQAQRLGQFGQQYQQAGQDARAEYDVTGLTEALQGTRERIANRQVKLREDLRNFEVNAEQNAVSREFVDDAKRKLQADATAELADLSIIEAAQTGNLQLANDQVESYLDELKTSFDFETKAIEAEISRLEAMDTRQADIRKEQLQIALQERTRNIETALADEREKRGYMVDAAANGADQGTLDAIRNASTPGEAALLAGPWIGRLDRLNTESLINQRSGNGSTEGLVTTEDGENGILNDDGTVTPVSEIDFDDPTVINRLPVSDTTKAVMSGLIKTKDLTPTLKAEVAGQLQKIGFNPNRYVTKKLQALTETWAAVPEQSRGVVEGLKFWERWTNPDVAAFESQRTLLTREIARLNDVGVLSDQDVAGYENAMPSRRDQSLDVVIKKGAGISGATAGTNADKAGTRVTLADGRQAIVGPDGDTLLDPLTGKPLQ